MESKKYFIKTRTRESIEAEEIFLDAEAIRSMEEKGKLEKPIKRRNFVLFYVLIIISLLTLFLRTGYLQIVKGDYYQDLARGNRLRIYPITAPRGIIYDRFYRRLLYNIPSFDLVISLADFLDNPLSVQDEILEKITDILLVQEADQEESGVSDSSCANKELQKQNFIAEFKQKIDEACKYTSRITLARGIGRSLALVLETMVGDWPGVRMEKNVQRQYLFSPSLSHVLGYTGQVDQDDLEVHPDYLLNDQIGKSGLEYQYEDVLRGEYGQEQVEVDPLGKTQNLLAFKQSQPGHGLVLFIDQELQEKLYQSLDGMRKDLSRSGNKIQKAVGIAVDPNNGGILALTSLPSFDSNLFAQGISQVDLEELVNRADQPFFNRALIGQYPPGSIIKPLVAAAALEEGIIKPFQQIDCQGMISIVNQYNPDVVYHFPDWKSHGLTDVMKAIAESCNIFFYALGGGHEEIEGLGIDRLKEYFQKFGLGQATQIDLPYEKVGLIPDKEWKATRGENWYLGDTYHLSIGQGDILITPIQMVMAIASIANGGILYQPQIVDQIVDADKNIIDNISSRIVRSNFIQSKNMARIRKAMREAVLSGSAQALSNLPVQAAGKTGTAQFGTDNQTHSWFVGFAPYEDPEIVLTILVEGGGEGHRAAVPVAKEVLEWYFSQHTESENN